MIITRVTCVATTNLALSGLQTVDGHVLTPGDTILLTGQTTASQNGLWLAAPTPALWTRPTEFATGATVTTGWVDVMQGTAHAGSRWVLQAGSLTVDTSAQVWSAGIAMDGGQL